MFLGFFELYCEIGVVYPCILCREARVAPGCPWGGGGGGVFASSEESEG